MYYIFDNELEQCGILSLEGKGCKFYNDKRTYAIANESGKEWSDTLEMYVEYGYPQTAMMTEGYHIGKKFDDGYFYVFRIYDVTDELVGNLHVKNVKCVNLCIWDLGKTVVEPITIVDATSQEAFAALLEKSDWRINNCEYSEGIKSITLEKMNTAQSYLQQFITEYSVEVRSYCKFLHGKIVEKLIDIEVRLGEQTNRRIEYSKNILNITRNMSDDTLYTKLYVYGKEGLTIANANNGRPFLVDDAANDKYNGGNKYLEGVVTNEAIGNVNALKVWGQGQLKYYNHPKYKYTVDVGQLGWIPNIGDSVIIADYEMEPVLLLTSRAIMIEESESDPFSNKVTFGEFVEIKATTPDLIWQLQALASQMAENNSTYLIKQFTPDGLDFASTTETKRIIIRVYKNGQNVTAQIDKSAFIWEKINVDGTHDDEWENAYAGRGNVIEVGIETADSVIRCKVDSGVSAPIRFATEDDAALYATFPSEQTDVNSEKNKKVVQSIFATANYIYWAQVYTGKLKPENQLDSVQLTRTTHTGSFVDSMILLNAGHGSSFGIETVAGVDYVWTGYYNPSTLKNVIARFPYTADKIMNYGDSSMWTYQPYEKYKRVSYDPISQMVMVSTGSTSKDFTFYAVPRSEILSRSWKPKHSIVISDIGFSPEEQVYQSSFLEFPYLYMTSGGANTPDDRNLYCIDMVSQSLVYKVTYTFTSIKKIGEYAEPEGVCIFSGPNNQRKLLQNFAFGSEYDDNVSPRINQIYEIKETMKE